MYIPKETSELEGLSSSLALTSMLADWVGLGDQYLLFWLSEASHISLWVEDLESYWSKAFTLAPFVFWYEDLSSYRDQDPNNENDHASNFGFDTLVF